MGDWKDGCGVDALQHGWCWRTGSATAEEKAAPPQLPPPPGDAYRWRQLSPGSNNWSCGITAESETVADKNALYCWGVNEATGQPPGGDGAPVRMVAAGTSGVAWRQVWACRRVLRVARDACCTQQTSPTSLAAVPGARPAQTRAHAQPQPHPPLHLPTSPLRRLSAAEPELRRGLRYPVQRQAVLPWGQLVVPAGPRGGACRAAGGGTGAVRPSHAWVPGVGGGPRCRGECLGVWGAVPISGQGCRASCHAPSRARMCVRPACGTQAAHGEGALLLQRSGAARCPETQPLRTAPGCHLNGK